MALKPHERLLKEQYRAALDAQAQAQRSGVQLRVVRTDGGRVVMELAEKRSEAPAQAVRGRTLLVWGGGTRDRHWHHVFPAIENDHVVVRLPASDRPLAGSFVELRDSKLDDLRFRDWWYDDLNSEEAMLMRRRLLRDPTTIPTAHDAPGWLELRSDQARAFDLARCSDAFLFGPPGAGKTRTLLGMGLAFLLQGGALRRRVRYFAVTRRGKDHAEKLVSAMIDRAPRWLDARRREAARSRLELSADFDLRRAEERGAGIDEELVLIDDANQISIAHALALRTAVEKSARSRDGAAPSTPRLRCVWAADRRGLRPIVQAVSEAHASVLKETLVTQIRRDVRSAVLRDVVRSPEGVRSRVVRMRADRDQRAGSTRDDGSFVIRTVAIDRSDTPAKRSSRCTRFVADLAQALRRDGDIVVLCPSRSREGKVVKALQRRMQRDEGARTSVDDATSTIAAFVGAETDDVLVDFTEIPQPVREDTDAARALLVAAMSRARKRCTVVIASDDLAVPAIQQLQTI